MKERRTFTLLALVLSVLVLGIAYAAISNVTLSVAGNVTASPDQGNFKVGFVGTYKLSGLTEQYSRGMYFLEGSDNDILGQNVPEGSYATGFLFHVKGLTGKGDKGTITLTVENGSTDIGATLVANAYPYGIESGDSEYPSEYFDITAKLGTTTLAAGQTTTLVLEIECIKTPIDGEATEQLQAKLIATPINS